MLDRLRSLSGLAILFFFRAQRMEASKRSTQRRIVPASSTERQISARIGCAQLLPAEHAGRATQSSVAWLQKDAAWSALSEAMLPAKAAAVLIGSVSDCQWAAEDLAAILKQLSSSAPSPSGDRRKQQCYKAFIDSIMELKWGMVPYGAHV